MNQSSLVSKARISISEIAILYYLQPFGFERAPSCSLKEYGMGKYEIDVLNKDKKIGIEYDGPWHSPESDLRKNNLFFKSFDRLIRIRDFRLPELNDSRVETYKIDTSMGLCADYENLLKTVFKSLKYSIDVDFIRDLDAITDLYQSMCSFVSDRVGERKLMKCGMEAEIIRYGGACDIDVRFDDGTIIKHRQYSQYKRGTIANGTAFHKLHVGERRQFKKGWGTLVAARKYDDVDVKFDDGFLVTSTTYSNFLNGKVGHNPRGCNSNLKNERLNESKVMRGGHTATIIEYRSAKDIDVQLDDGTIVMHRKYSDFKAGKIRKRKSAIPGTSRKTTPKPSPLSSLPPKPKRSKTESEIENN